MIANSWTPYCGAASLPDDWYMQWNFDPVLLAGSIVALWIAYRRAPSRLPWHLSVVGVFWFAFVSPFCVLGSALFSVRVVHHLLLTLALAPFLVSSLALHKRPTTLSLTMLTTLQIGIYWAWHAPPLYALALANDGVFWIMQASITVSAALWWAKLRQARAYAAVASLLAMMVQMGALGALITFAGRPLYAPHWLTTQAWGLSPLEDQQIAGLIMWAPAALAYLLVALALLYRSMGTGKPIGMRLMNQAPT